MLIELKGLPDRQSIDGLGGLALNEEAFQAWRAYDHWHYEVSEASVTWSLWTDCGFVVESSFVFVHRYSEGELLVT